MPYTITLEKTGRKPFNFQSAALSPRFDLPVERFVRTVQFSDNWSLPLAHFTTAFIETYDVQKIDLEGKTAVAVFSKLRRSSELLRHFDPTRLPQ